MALIKKLIVMWLISLFAWNIALAGIPSILFCLHQDFLLHVPVSVEDSADCAGSHEHAHEHTATEAETATSCAFENGCTDFKLIGAEQLPIRLNECEALELPVITYTLLINQPPALPPVLQPATSTLFLRAPPSVHWLTDTYLSKTVLRV